jgi:hypothetical protein
MLPPCRLIFLLCLEADMTDAAALSYGGETFQLGRAVTRAFQVLGRGFGRFLLITSIVFLPVLLAKFAILFSMSPHRASEAVGFAGLLQLPLTLIAHGACMVGAYRLMRGEEFSVGESIRAVAGRFFPLLGTGIVVMIAFGLAFLLLVIPGLIVAMMFYVAGPVCMFERRGVFDSLARSRELTAGFRWPIFGVFIVLLLAGLIAGGLLAFLTLNLHVSGFVNAMLDYFWTSLSGAVGAILVAVVYHDLRVAKEGVDIEKLATVFD